MGAFGLWGVAGQTANTASTNPEQAWDRIFFTGGGFGRRVQLTQASNSTVQVGQPLFVVTAVTTVPASGPVLVVEPFITASAVGRSVVGFAGQTASGNAMIWMQESGPGTVMLRGTGATASISAGQPIIFATSATGFVLSGNPFAVISLVASTDAAVYARVMNTGTSNAGSLGTMASASTDTKTVEAFIYRHIDPGW